MRCVLLIEDDHDDQELFREALAHVDAEAILTIVSNGVAALDFLDSAIVRPDIIFSDINMPAMDGLQFLKRIKAMEDLRDIPVIMLTTSTTVLQDTVIGKLGARELLVKPNDFHLLCECLRKAIIH